MSIRILIADDHQLVIDGIKLMLQDADGLACVASAPNGKEALDILAQQSVDVVLLDMNMPVMDGMECCRNIVAQYPDVKVLALSMIKEASLIKKMLELGAKGFLFKNAGQDEVIEAIHKAHQGEQVFSDEVLAIVMGSFGQKKKSTPQGILPRVSRREKQVLSLIVWEKTTQEIAEELCISPGTVETHRRNLLHKLDVRNTAGLVRVALEFDLVDKP
ncbi:MAG: response regulator [Bacteroidia bacterium]